ncbi:hypothetical protein AGMMS4956_01780 [Bacteroidia bacterium]|nr:hypothetical protein AGMMS4956_01780 [Bacteroidia bacterium]
MYFFMKHKTIKFIIFSFAFFAITFSAKSQVAEVDVIEVKTNFWGSRVYWGGNLLNLYQLNDMLQIEPLAAEAFKNYKKNMILAGTLAYIGGFMIGWSVGTVLADRGMNWAMMGVGAGFIVLPIPFSTKSVRQLHDAVGLYNDYLRRNTPVATTEVVDSTPPDAVHLNGDAVVRCSITKVLPQQITYKYSTHNGELRDTTVLRKDVIGYKRNYFDNAPFMELPELPYDPWRISAYTGVGTRAAKIADNLTAADKKLAESLMNGWTIGGDITYVFTRNIGVAIAAHNFRASASYETRHVADNILHISPILTLSFNNKKEKWFFNFGVGVGYLRYTSTQTQTNYYPIKITASTFGISYFAGADYKLNKHLAISANLYSVSGMASTFKVDNGVTIETKKLSGKDRENLSNLSINIGLRGYFR